MAEKLFEYYCSWCEQKVYAYAGDENRDDKDRVLCNSCYDEFIFSQADSEFREAVKHE